MAKKIAFFVGQIMHNYQMQIIRGVTEEANGNGYRIEIFSNFGTYGDNFLHAEGEKNVVNLPNLKDYDAIIVAPDTYDIAGMYEALSEKIASDTTCPVVSLRCEDSNLYNVLIDDERSMEEMVNHLIEEHGMKRICFMTGRMDLVDARRRLQGYRNAMEKHELMVTDHMMFEGDYWINKGEEAVDWFLSGGSKPEVIVSSNDYMAISVCDALVKKGLRIPQDISVTGFDNIDEAKFYEPPLTCVEVQGEVMGRTAVKMLKNIFENKPQEKYEYVPVTLSRGGSCGCERQDNNMNNIREMYNEKEYLKNAVMQNAYMNVDMENCNNLDELLQIAFKYSAFFRYNALYICLCERVSGEDEEIEQIEHYTEQVSIRAIMRDNKEYILCDEKFERRDILPDKYRRENDTIYCYPIHYKNRCTGYLVIDTDHPESLRQYFVTWLLAFSNYLDKVRIYSENKSLMNLRQQSMLDELTGLNNRREYERILQRKYASAKLKQKGFFILSCDMDGLKMINDTYGHLEGDKAIKAFADILKKSYRDGMYSARVGGDEFNICYDTTQKADVLRLVEAIRKGLAEYNERVEAPYELSASIGYAFCSGQTGLISCMQKADDSMYRDKANKRFSRSIQSEWEDIR